VCVCVCVCVSFGKMDVTAKCYLGLYKDYKCKRILDIFKCLCQNSLKMAE